MMRDDALVNAPPQTEPLSVPDRFEALRSAGEGSLRGIVSPVNDALEEIDARFEDMSGADRGSLMLLRGRSGAGKSTFLDTIGMFREGVLTRRIAGGANVNDALRALGASSSPRVVVMEGREALHEVSKAELEAALHAINSFVRTAQGRNTLVVWPTNRDDLTNRLAELGGEIGGRALLGTDGPVVQFNGPARDQFVGIAERTVAALNDGASLAALGLTEARASEIAEECPTIGDYLGAIRGELARNTRRVQRLLVRKQERLWVVVVAGNDPDGDVAALTRGSVSMIDIERLMTSTNANVVSDLKNHQDTLGILGTVLDARVMHMDVLTALAVAREYGDARLHDRIRDLGGAVSARKTADQRVRASELGVIMSGGSLSTRKRGTRPRSNTLAAFDNLARIASKDDGLLNRAVGEALQSLGLTSKYDLEVPLVGSGYTYTTDLVVDVDGDPVRVEFMWRSRTGRAEIANYVLDKLEKYARTIGLIVRTAS